MLFIFFMTQPYSELVNNISVKNNLLEFVKNYNECPENHQLLIKLINNCIQSVDPIEQRKDLILKKINRQDDKNKLLVSIVIDCFGSVSHIDDLLDSIYTQNVDFAYEIICLGNIIDPIFSKKINFYTNLYPNIRALSSSNYDDIFSRNNGFINCNGELILHLSHNDILPPLILQRLVNMYRNIKSDVIALDNIIALYNGEFGNVPQHDKFYTSFEMGQLKFGLLDWLKDRQGNFGWGLYNGVRLFTRTSLIECGGFIGLRKDYTYNLGIIMLLKGYDIDILNNGFNYQYHDGTNWFDDIFNLSYHDQVKFVLDEFAELFDTSKINESSVGLLWSELPWLNKEFLEAVIKAYRYEREGLYKEAYKKYISIIQRNNNCHIKIYLKCIRAMLLFDKSIDNLDFNNIITRVQTIVNEE